ncbi:MAG TPA: hypothetical protein VF065_06145, partial [Ilumatobacter sp.]
VDGRDLLVPNVEHRAVIVDLTGDTPFAVPAPFTRDPETARRLDLGHRYVASGRLRLGLELLTSGGAEDDVARALAELVTQRLEGNVVTTDNVAALPALALAVRGVDPLLEHWAVAPRTSITVVSRREAPVP